MMTSKMADRDSREEMVKAFRLFGTFVSHLPWIFHQFVELCLLHHIEALIYNFLSFASFNQDDDETGKISFRNLKRVAMELGESISDEELQEMIDEADRNGDGEVSQDEFITIMEKTNLF